MKEREILSSQVSGTVKKLNGGHGWIGPEEPISNKDIYFKKDDVQNQIILKPGRYVIFDISQNNYGLIAINVTPKIRSSQVLGTVKKLNGDHGWIDLEEPIDNNNEIYFEKDDVQNQIILKPGQYVIFDVSKNNYGLIAINVTPMKKKLPALFYIIIFTSFITLIVLFYSLYRELSFLNRCFFSYLIAINITTMVLYGYDKIIARLNGKKQKILKENKIARLQGKNIEEVNAKITIEDLKARISERALHFSELLLGTPGAYLSQQLFRHKTVKLPFQILFWLIVLFQMIIITFSFIITTVLKQSFYIVFFSVYILSVVLIIVMNVQMYKYNSI